MPLIFETKPGSGYDDLAGERYHFPNRYLPIAQAGIGDWVVYKKPRRGSGAAGYFAVARLVAIEPDSRDPSSSYGRLADYLPFDYLVPQVDQADRPFEAILRAVPVKARGVTLQGKSVRPLSTEDFAAITLAGMHATFDPANAVRLELDQGHCDRSTFDILHAPQEQQEREIRQILLNRKIRDAAFRRAVCDAYDDRCAVTGLKIVNGGGKSEVQAAHIWSVAEGGPDIVQNGIALSGTAHWLFDRKLISISDDYRLLISHNKVPSDLQRLFANQLERILLPTDRAKWPHRAYLRKHRESAVLSN